MRRIIALDPGGTTGIAVWDVGDVWNWYQIGPDEHHKDLWDFLRRNTVGQSSDYTIVCEKFDFRQHDDHRSGVELISREYIGVAKLFGAMYHHPVVLQTAGQAKGFIPDKPKNGLEANAKLKVMGLYKPGMPHANDAMRHLIYYMVFKQKRSDLVECWRKLV